MLQACLPVDETAWQVENGLPPLIEHEEDMATKPDVIEERLGWTIKIGWGAIGVFAVAFGWLLTFYIPQQMASTQTAIKADTASQLEPLKIQLATINGLLQLKETRNVSDAIRLGVNFSEPKYAIAAVKAIAQQAQVERIQTQPAVLARVSEQIRQAAQSQPALVGEAWSAQLALVDYRSSLPTEPSPPISATPKFVFHGAMMDGGSITNMGQKLDGAYWRNFTFENARIEYDGGPMILENVRFINCTFVVRYSPRGEQLAEMVLTQNAVTGSLG
jgi:hypothetical protein